MNVVYTINGEGMGHASRSSVVIDYLLSAGHAVAIFSSGKQQLQFLREKFGSVAEVFGLHMVYRDNKVQRLSTALRVLSNVPVLRRDYATIRNSLVGFDPDVVLTDFDFHGPIISRLYRVPLISLDNIQFLTRAKFEVPTEDLLNYELNYMVAKFMVPSADYYLITSFCDAEVRKPEYTKKVSFVPPLLRRQILEEKPSAGNHILVYQTSDNHASLLRVLSQSPEHFIAYKVKSHAAARNITVKPFSERTFIHDLATAKAVILNGGFTAITEALYFRKPILSIPIQNHFEQKLNGMLLQQNGFGIMVNKLSSASMMEFIRMAARFEPALKRVVFGNDVIFKKLESIFAEIRKTPRRVSDL